jgi:hypothetical protein
VTIDKTATAAITINNTATGAAPPIKDIAAVEDTTTTLVNNATATPVKDAAPASVEDTAPVKNIAAAPVKNAAAIIELDDSGFEIKIESLDIPVIKLEQGNSTSEHVHDQG